MSETKRILPSVIGSQSNPVGLMSGDKMNERAAELTKTIKTHLQTMRPWDSEFLNKEQFAKPTSSAEVKSRLEGNLSFFAVNYILVCAAVGCIAVLLNWHLLILAVILGGAWFWLLSQPSSIKIGDHSIAKVHAQVALAAVSLLLVFLFAGTVVFAIIGMSAVLVLGHAIFHKGKCEEEDEETGI
ncbi:unnamed protein product [Vitrella brassicaformis CCMP3155]|uniref:PRA1 family protein n=2 Tax=Vitrella brassicaformis TaxID=1169539 RepID=A0A0G4EMZ7_VITBC|nr:unnamed protein product [Vitrella brassicaformis CCMP3155]|eukprot:CEL98360.1 unnamed protein product [Vitrella brassicaformis CCMP3155]